MIHERRKQIGLRRVAGVARFGEQGEVGELQAGDEVAFDFDGRYVPRTQADGVCEGGQQEDACQNKEYCGEGAMALWHQETISRRR